MGQKVDVADGKANRESAPGTTPAFASLICLQLIKEKRKGEDKDMPKYVIERDLPGIGNATGDQAGIISQKSCLARFKKKLNRRMLCCAFAFV